MKRNRMLRAAFLLLVLTATGFAISLVAVAQEKAPAASAAASMDTYYKSIDYSCETDQDCVIKDIHNCCGYYPACTNSAAQVAPDKVNRLCQEQGVASVCGFPSIEGCVCENGKCKGMPPVP